MIEKHLRSTSGKILLTIPTELHELTLGHLMALQEKEILDDLDAISILSGTPKCELQNIKHIADLSEFGEGILSLSQQIKLLDEHNTLPVRVTFTIKGRKVEVPVINNLAIEPAGAFMAAREIIADEIRQHIAKYGEQNWQETFQPSLRACCEILAQFFYCRATWGTGGTASGTSFFYLLSELTATEAKLLATTPSALELTAGIGSFEKFSYINTVNALAGGDITKWNLILAMPYERVLTKLLTRP